MRFDVYLLSLAFSLLFLAIVINLIRQRRLREQYALLWIIVSLIMVALSLKRSVLSTLAAWVDINYAPSMLFLIGMVFSFFLILHLTMVISRQSEQIVALTQDLALLRQDLKHCNKINSP